MSLFYLQTEGKDFAVVRVLGRDMSQHYDNTFSFKRSGDLEQLKPCNN
jgi:hypothetical protein